MESSAGKGGVVTSSVRSNFELSFRPTQGRHKTRVPTRESIRQAQSVGAAEGHRTELEPAREALGLDVCMVVEAKARGGNPGVNAGQFVLLHFPEAMEALKIVGNTYQRHSLAPKSALIQFN
jgi:hypothetical protein